MEPQTPRKTSHATAKPPPLSPQWWVVAPLVHVLWLLSGIRQFEFAHRLNLHRTTIGQLLGRTMRVRYGDMRVVQIAQALGVPVDQAFVPWTPEAATVPITPTVLIEAARLLEQRRNREIGRRGGEASARARQAKRQVAAARDHAAADHSVSAID